MQARECRKIDALFFMCKERIKHEGFFNADLYDRASYFANLHRMATEKAKKGSRCKWEGNDAAVTCTAN